jgi:glycosyltransferase involved in cell wall biosynthesis
MDLQPGSFQTRIKEFRERIEGSVTFVGKYDHDELAHYISEVDWVVIPSIWWENSPLVIQEAFHFGRPVICSNIGGMAEKVADGVNGLHFRVNDASDLAAVMQKAVESPGLWERLREGIRPVHSMEDHARTLSSLYGELRAQKVSANGR